MWYVVRVVVIVFVSTVIAYVVVEFVTSSRSAMRFLAPLGRRLERIALPVKAVPAVFLAPFDSKAAHSVMATLYRRGEVVDSQVMILVLIVSPFTALNTVLKYSLPIALGSLGLVPALIYLLISLVPALTRFCMGVLFGLRMSRRGVGESCGSTQVFSKERKPEFREALKRGVRLASRLCLRITIALMIVNTLIALGVFDLITPYLKPIAHAFRLGPKATMIFAVSVIRPSLAIITLGSMLDSGVISLSEGFKAMVIGHILFFLLMDTPQAIIPFYTAFYNTRIAFKIVLLVLASQLISLPIQLALINLALS